ncbi:MAG: hypothetical protein IK052_01480 [Bacteroidales bacterium]|nr:hypothetical protein [Bacteroidales bacterium]
MISRALILPIAACLLVSCRAVVLEDRTMCPSFLFFDVADESHFQKYSDVFTTVYAHPEGRLLDEAGTSLGSIDDGLFFFTVRGTAAVKGYGLMGEEGLLRDGSEWTVPLGRDYAPLFRFGYMAAVEEESFTVPVEFTKEYSHVMVQFLGADTFDYADGRFPFYITVRGNTCGLDGLTGLPVRGPFQVTPEEMGIGLFEFNLPRQADHDLVLEMYAREGLYEYRDFQVSYSLYEILRDKGGITWTEKNLPDLYIEINYEETTVYVGVYPWGEQELQYGL